MEIVEHRLKGVPFEATPNMGGPLGADYLVMHYTATASAAPAIAALRSKVRAASAHVVVDIDGSLTQLVPFDRVAWHAGKSQWAGRSGCNQFSLGIEIANPGPLRLVSGQPTDVYGRPWHGPVIDATHKNGGPYTHWAAYEEAQLSAVEELASLLVAAYRLKDVVGHDDIAPGRKIDPGPAFPMETLRGRLFGRADDGPEVFVTSALLNVRKGPAVSFDPVPGSPLPNGVRVTPVARHGTYLHVVTEDGNVEGWVASRFLSPA